MARVVIVVGNAMSFMAIAKRAVNYAKKSGLRRAIIPSCYLPPLELIEVMANCFSRERDEPLLLAYVGHGCFDGWGYTEGEKVSYQSIAILLRIRRGPVMVVNDTCYSGAVQLALNETLGPGNCGLISSCGPDEETYSGCLMRVLSSWARKEVYVPNSSRRRSETQEVIVPAIPTCSLADSSSNLSSHLVSGDLVEVIGSLPEVRTEPIEPCLDRRWGARFDHFFFPNEH